MRKLVTIQTIKNLEPIEGADLIEKATILGWSLVVKKDEFKIGDKCVYFEIDSYLPIKPEYEFLRKSSYKNDEVLGEGFRLRTVKLKGVISQGLALPKTILPEETPMEDGYEVTEILGVKKYEPPIPAQLSGKMVGFFPSWGRKTDQERCQNLVSEIETEIKNNSLFEVTIKLDGSSMSVGHNNGEVVVCSRNISLKLDQEGNSFVDVSKELGLIEKIKSLGNIIISGELCGPGIQGNKENLTKHTFFVFDIFDVDSQSYISTNKKLEIVNQLGLTHVPILEYSKSLSDLNLNSIEDILSYSKGKSLNSDIREGVVFKRIDGGFSFKAINNDWLIKFD